MARGREERDKEVAKLIEDIVFNNVNEEMENKLAIKHLRNILQALTPKQDEI